MLDNDGTTERLRDSSIIIKIIYCYYLKYLFTCLLKKSHGIIKCELYVSTPSSTQIPIFNSII